MNKTQTIQLALSILINFYLFIDLTQTSPYRHEGSISSNHHRSMHDGNNPMHNLIHKEWGDHPRDSKPLLRDYHHHHENVNNEGKGYCLHEKQRPLLKLLDTPMQGNGGIGMVGGGRIHTMNQQPAGPLFPTPPMFMQEMQHRPMRPNMNMMQNGPGAGYHHNQMHRPPLFPHHPMPPHHPPMGGPHPPQRMPPMAPPPHALNTFNQVYNPVGNVAPG